MGFMMQILLQLGLGPPEFIILFLILVSIFIYMGRWVYIDATERGSRWAWQWAVGIVFLFILGIIPGFFGVVVYLAARESSE